MEKFLSEHRLAMVIATKIARVVASYLFIGMGWWLIADILGINTDALRFWDWVMIALFTKVLVLNATNSNDATLR